jgi:hypothetical protein
MKPAICTQCGGTIKVDETKELGICEYCNTPFVTERVINNYVTKNVHNVTENVTKIIYGKEKDEGEDFFRRALTLIDLEDFVPACDALRKATKLSPQKAEFWFYRLVAESKNLTTTVTFFHDECDRAYGGDELFSIATKFFKVAKEDEKRSLGEKFGFTLTTPEALIVDLLERVPGKERENHLVMSLHGKTVWNDGNCDSLNRLHLLSLESGWLLGFSNVALLDKETIAQIKRLCYEKSIAFYGEDRMEIKSYGAWFGEDESRPEIPERIKILTLGKGGGDVAPLILPSTLETVNGVDLGLPRIKIEGANVPNSMIDNLLNCARPEVLYLPEGKVCRFSRGAFSSESPEKTVVVCSEACKITITYASFGANNQMTYDTRQVGGIFGGQIFYPKTKNLSGLVAFHENLKKHFAKELESGEIRGLANDEDIQRGIIPKVELPKKPGLFARLFGKK